MSPIIKKEIKAVARAGVGQTAVPIPSGVVIGNSKDWGGFYHALD